MSSFQSSVTFSPPVDFPFSFPFKALICAQLNKPSAGDLSGTYSFMCDCALVSLCIYCFCVCVFISSMWWEGSGEVVVVVVGACCCIWTLGSRLISLSHPQHSPGSLAVSINNRSLWLPQASCLKSQSSMKWPLLNYWDGHI